ncbi:lipoprotein signal peptidase [Lacihabitans lacunae]|uniref:Lipoprotein signal peptidase n=1 Tax=Lacihabitans lacunae TaxID=1028214 RepID=A0ABV7YUK5_9BACT
MSKSYKYFLFALLLIIIDQIIKLWMHYVVVPQHFGNIDIINGVFKLHYVTNKGMAFGIELGGDYGKLLLTSFRLVAMVAIAWYLNYQANKAPSNGLLWAIAAILAGAIGNVIDSIFYGVFIEGNAPFDAPYPWFHGQVIDMFYFYFADGFWPNWIPIIGGNYHSTPIFNFADACIFCGVVAILLFQKSFLEMKPMDDEIVKELTDEVIGEEDESTKEDNQQ